MSGSGTPLPNASFPVPPPVARLQVVTGPPGSGFFTQQGLELFTKIWAALQGGGGTIEQIAALQAAVETIEGEITIIFAMHGDGTLSADGTLIVTKTNGTPFGFFATGTDAAQLTGTLAPTRIADQSLPQAKTTDLARAYTFSTLPAGVADWTRTFITDCNSVTFGSPAAGGGTNPVPVYKDGAGTWRIG